MDLNNRRTGKHATKPCALGLLGHSVIVRESLSKYWVTSTFSRSHTYFLSHYLFWKFQRFPRSTEGVFVVFIYFSVICPQRDDGLPPSGINYYELNVQRTGTGACSSVCVLLIARLLRGVGRWARKPVNHTSWVAVVTPNDRPKSVRNRCLIELFCAVVCVVTLPFGHFCLCRGFCHRTGSNLLLFVFTYVLFSLACAYLPYCSVLFLVASTSIIRSSWFSI